MFPWYLKFSWRHADGDLQSWNSKTLAPWKESYDKPRQYIKKQRRPLMRKVYIVKTMVFFNNHIHMWELDHEEDWALKNWCLQTVVLEKTLRSPLDFKENKAVNPKENQPWIFIGRTDAKASAPKLWPPDAKRQLFGKGPVAGKDWRREEKGMTEDEMVGWHHQLSGHGS